MNNIYPSTYYVAYLESASDLFKYCAAGDIDKVKSLLSQNENIYQETEGSNYVPMFITLSCKNLELVSELLDIYERDLEALKETSFKSALIALPEDQTEEFLLTIETEAVDDCEVIPVLLKNNNADVPKRVFLRKKLKDRNDLSLQLARKLRKNGFCDLNWRYKLNASEDSFLHLAVFNQMMPVIKRLLSHQTVEKQVENSSHHTPLHYALFTGNLDIVNLLLSTSNYEKFYDNPSYLYQAVLSEKQRVVDFMINEMMKGGKSLQDVLEIPFSQEDYNGKTVVDYLLHVLVKIGSNLEFPKKSPLKLNEQNFCKQNSEGETIMHQLVLSPSNKLNATIKIITSVAEKYPRLLLIENKKRQLPLHYAALHCIHGQRLYKHMLKLTVQESGNPDIFFVDPETAVARLENAIFLNNSLSEEYLQNFEKILKSHGLRFLHEVIRTDMKLKTLKAIFSSPVKLNPNEFYEGTNAFLLLSYDIESSFRLNCFQEIRLRLLNDYHPIEDPNARDASGTTLFMYILGYCQDNNFIRSLINAGADCRARSSEGLTCLHHAASNPKNKAIVQLMLDNGADQSAVTASNKLAIHFAIQHEILNNVQVLLPLMSDDELKSKCGELNETLIQMCMRLCNMNVMKVVYDYFEKKGIEIDVNSTNDDGNNLPMIAISSEHLELLFSKFFDEIDFYHKNQEGQNLVHKVMIYEQVLTRWKNIFDKYPTLRKIMNDQINLEDANGITPMDNLVAQCQYRTSSDVDYFEFFFQQVTIENLRNNFHKCFQYSLILNIHTATYEKYPDFLDNLGLDTCFKILGSTSSDTQTHLEFIFKKPSVLMNEAHDSKGRNILHIVCEKNDLQIIDCTLKMLPEDVFMKLMKKTDEFGKTPYEHLNDTNRKILEKCFN